MRLLLVIALAGSGCDQVFELHRERDAPPPSIDADVSCTTDDACGAGLVQGTCTCGQCSYPDTACPVSNLRWDVDATGSMAASCIPAIDKIATRVYHACATMTDGTAWCWGYNSHGQLGLGQVAPIASTLPVPVQSTAGVVTGLAEVRPGALSTCALKTDGSVICWGSNLNGELGGAIPPGPDQRSLEPVEVRAGTGSLANVTALSMGFFHGCAIVAPPGLAKEIWCWGNNTYGQLGSGTTAVADGAVKVENLPAGEIFQVAAGGDHTCAIVRPTGDTLKRGYCWGRTADGRLGSSAVAGERQLAPIIVQWISGGTTVPMPDVDRLAIGNRYTCAVKQPLGEFFCWGLNTNGAHGDGTTLSHTVATKTVGLGDGERSWLAAGDLHTCGMRSTTLYCWGRDDNGELGNGATTGNQLMPVPVISNLTQRDLIAGWNFTCALDGSRQLRCWGANVNGELGIGNTADQPSPVEVPKSAFCPRS